jgi:glycosyltransferase involved in cell wall biosynthesis
LHQGVPPFKQIHFYGGTYAGLAKALKPFISYRSYLWMTWIEGMVKEKFSGLGKLCLSNSAKTQEEVKHYFGLDSVVIWRPMDTTLFQPNDPVKCRLQLGLASEKPIGLFVGHTGLTKNFALVEQMTERFPDIQWVLALRDAIPPHLQGQSHIHLVHQATREHLRLLYNAADFSLCPSHYEPFGYVVAEALACGTPVIAAPGGASRLFLQHSPLRELFVHSSTDTEGFVRAIENVLADPATYRQAVIREIRPSIEEIMTPENWWARFINIVQL